MANPCCASWFRLSLLHEPPAKAILPKPNRSKTIQIALAVIRLPHQSNFGFLRRNDQPVQYWSSAEHRKGFIDILLRCVHRPGNQDRLYDLMQCGKRGFLGIGQENDGVSILRASGVGGGSLIYSNITYLLVKNWEKGGGRECLCAHFVT